MVKQDEIRQRLIDGTIKVIARDGLDKASTKLIGIQASVNEAYIYRCFEDKEDMFAKTFASLDEELIAVSMRCVVVMYDEQIEYKQRCRIFFDNMWRFLLGDIDKTLAFTRLFYSTYYSKYSADEHYKRYLPLVDKIKIAFRDDANVWMLLNHMLSTMLLFAVKVYDGSVPDDDDTQEHVFRLVYVSIQQYFKDKE